MEGKQQVRAEKVKTKVRFTSLDVAAMVAELQILIGLRVSNIYDLNPTTYLFKASRSEEKHNLLIENGVRFHLTEQKPDKKTIPSGFTMRFRRFLRSKRIESIRQVGVERVVVISFGSQAFANHLILELYSQGNIILTDNNYRILQCIRSHEFSDKIKTAVGEIYPFEQAANLYIENIDISREALDKNLIVPQTQTSTVVVPKKKGKDQKQGAPKNKDIIFKLIPCLYPLVIEHILTTKSIDPEGRIEGQQGIEIVLKGAAECLNFLKNFISRKQPGYLYSKGEDYFEFSPFGNCKLDKWQVTKLDSFGKSVTEYFSKYKRSAHQQEEAFEQIAWKKYEQIRKDQEERVKKLVEEQQTYGGKAQLIETNIGEVEAVLKIIGTMESNGYSWEAMERMVSQSRKTGDPLANMIHSFNAVKRQITVLLSDTSNGEAELCALTPVELHVDYNAYTNATMYYEGRKKQQQKQARTREASDQVLKLAQKDAEKKIQKKKNELLLKAVPTRKQLWFEKFYWFVSADGWLIISGRDSHQNELLVKRYMKAGDLYMHSDYGGAASTIIKGPPPKGVPAPLGTLEQAAIFTVCRSKAWDTKIISSAWWVYHDQVSKSAPTGEFLPTGSFMIRGKRNFIHPNRMQMGLTLLYRLDNQSMQRRIEHKRSLQEEIKKEEADIANIGLERVASSQQEDEQYAIIDLEAEARLAKEKKKERTAQNKANKAANANAKLPQQPEALKKQASIQEKPVQSEQQEDNSDSEDQKAKQSVKKEGKKNDSKKNDKKKVEEEPAQKHKNRNKKKLKKLEKYMEEQDEDERQLIMKMLGAKEMKHLKEEEEEPQPEKKEPKGGKKQQKKKGIQKYINFNSAEDENLIDTDKVLFLKDKPEKSQKPDWKKKKEQSSSEEQPPQQIKEEPELQSQASEPVIEEKQPVESVQSGTVQNAETPANTQNAEQTEEKQEEIVDSDQEQQQQKPQQKQEEQQIDEKIIDSELSELPRLAGRIQGLDKWDALIPMCAPYATMKDNRFKVKLVPGGLKKGKAARSILSYFATNELDENEKAFVRALPEQEVINAVIGNVKLAGAGLLKIDQKSKAEKKEKRKEADKKAEKKNE